MYICRKHGPTGVTREIIAVKQLEIGHLRPMDVYINEVKYYCAKLDKRILMHKKSDVEEFIGLVGLVQPRRRIFCNQSFSLCKVVNQRVFSHSCVNYLIFGI